jgi:hypothetical protein
MKPIYKIALGTITGGILGFAYFHYFGCTSGCAITSNWSTSTLFGAVFGLILSYPSKKDNSKETNETKD